MYCHATALFNKPLVLYIPGKDVCHWLVPGEGFEKTSNLSLGCPAWLHIRNVLKSNYFETYFETSRHMSVLSLTKNRQQYTQPGKTNENTF